LCTDFLHGHSKRFNLLLLVGEPGLKIFFSRERAHLNTPIAELTSRRER
jgi:hypothetical protein